ncbi:MAG: hypothetical protein CMJ48_05840 [Planctomycetaceae bacterium]|nr:hypothetical protein [Planctomycetaceae bacterium]
MPRPLRLCLGLLFALLPALTVSAADGNRLAYLDENNPYYPHAKFPKLTTPQWVGEEGVEAVVVFAIDDMRDTQKYEDYLRPILIRLKQIDGRAPVSIMTCNVDPRDEQIQKWLTEGLSIDVHTVDHPCPLLYGGDFPKAKSTVDRCIDLLNEIPGNKPVAFRMPCCDSLNTVSPRFYAEIFNGTSKKGNYLQVSSSVFNVFTSDDPEIPRELVLDADGTECFKKYLPKNLKRGNNVHNTFVNTIENYPYPYVINRLCWEFPCVTPSDWSAQHFQGKNNDKTLADWKAALDITVKKQGVFNLVFHPHGWIRNDQVVDFIDYAVKKHGKKVKFLSFKEAVDRLNKNLLEGQPLRTTKGGDRGVRLVDLNDDGYLDVFKHSGGCRVWGQPAHTWKDVGSPALSCKANGSFGVTRTDGAATVTNASGAWSFVKNQWVPDPALAGLAKKLSAQDGTLRLRDINQDGRCEVLHTSGQQESLYAFDQQSSAYVKLPYTLTPERLPLKAVRFVDVNADGRDDVVFSNHERYGVWLFSGIRSGWSTDVLAGKRGAKKAEDELPMLVRPDGTDNGFFVHSSHLFWQNEDTAELPDLVDRRSFRWLLQGGKPE